MFDRAIAKGRSGKIIVTALVVLIGVPFAICVLGWMGQVFVVNNIPSYGVGRGLLWETIEVYIDPSNKPESFHSLKRLYFLIVGTTGVFLLDGLLVSMLVSWFENRRNRWENGDLHYPSKALGNFCVVIGGNEMVPDLVGHILKEKGVDYVLVMTDSDVAALRKKMYSKLGNNEDKVVIYYGERTSKEDLQLLHLPETKNDIYVIGERLDVDQRGSHHDVKNMDCVQKMAELLQTCPEKKTCRVMFEYQSTFSVFQFADVCKKISDVLYFKPFDYFETWAQKVMVCKELDLEKNNTNYLPLEGNMPMTAESEDSVHLIIIGMSRMGIALAIEAAHLAHYPNFITKGKMTRISFVDVNAQKEMNCMLGQYRELFAVSRWRYVEARAGIGCSENWMKEETVWRDPRKDEIWSPYKDSKDYTLGKKLVDVEWQFIQGDVEMPSVQNFIREEALKQNIRLTIAICFPQDNVSLGTSLYLPNEVYETGSNVQQVLVYQPFGDAMRRSFSDNNYDVKSYKIFSKLRVFGMMDGCFSITDQDTIKYVCDVYNQQYSNASKDKIFGRNMMRKKLGLPTNNVGKTSVAKQWSSYYSASHLWTKLRSVLYTPHQDISDMAKALLAEVEHVRWNMEQLIMGYAPLNAKEFHTLMERRVEAQEIPMPKEEVGKLNSDNNKDVKKEDYQKVVEWLDAWRGYDELREQLKADMVHADICSLEVLRIIDEEAVDYDRILVSILPQIYNQIMKDDK